MVCQDEELAEFAEDTAEDPGDMYEETDEAYVEGIFLVHHIVRNKKGLRFE